MNLDDRRTLTKIAYLYYIDGLTQAKIGKKYDVSRPVISKALQKAKTEGIVEIYIKDESFHTVKLEKKIEEKYNLDEVIVVSTDNLSDETILKNMGKAAASYVINNLKDNMKLGVSWGRSLHSFAEEFPYERNESIYVVPLIGGMGRNKVEYHSNQLVNVLAHKLGAKCTYLYAPAIVKSADLKERLIETEEFSEELQEGRSVDIAVVGIGNPFVESTMTDIGYIDEKDLKELESSGIVGDINSQFFDASGEETYPNINDRVIGISLNDLKKIEKVVCVGYGNRKVNSIHLAATYNWINTLVTDDKTAQKLLEK